MIFPVLAEKIQRRDGTEEEITLHLSSLLSLFQQISQSATDQISAFPPLVMKSRHTGAVLLSTFYYPHATLFVFKFAINKSVRVCMRVCMYVCVNGSCCWPIDLLSV